MNRGAAEESLHEAEGVIEDARAHLERYAPGELAVLSETLFGDPVLPGFELPLGRLF